MFVELRLALSQIHSHSQCVCIFTLYPSVLSHGTVSADNLLPLSPRFDGVVWKGLGNDDGVDSLNLSNIREGTDSMQSKTIRTMRRFFITHPGKIEKTGGCNEAKKSYTSL